MKQVWPIHIAQKYLAIHLHLDGEKMAFYALKLGIKATDLTILDSFRADSLEHLLKQIDKKLPVLLVVNGTKIINKKLGKSPNYLSEVLFNNPLHDFYLNEIELEEEMLVSLTRKDHIDAILEQFKTAGLSVVDFRVGAWHLKGLALLLESQNEIPAAGTIYVKTEQNLIPSTKFSDTSEPMHIGEEQLPKSHGLALALALNYLSKASSSNYNELLAQASEDFKYQSLFKKVGIAMLGFMLISMLASYLLSGHYSDKQLELQAELAAHTKVKTQVESLQNDRDYKLQILGNSALDNNQLLSSLLFEIGASVPNEIQLSELTVFPVKGKIKAGELVGINKENILIKGQTASTQDFSQWLEKLRAMNWITQVEVVDFQRKQRWNEFELIIKI